MGKFDFIIEGEPVGKSRPRWSNGHVYTPRKTQEYEEKVALAYRAAGGIQFDEEDEICVVIDAYFKIPKSFTGGKRVAAMHKVIRPTKRPDVDNVIKSILDGLNGVAYADDKQVVDVVCRKHYSPDKGYAFVRIFDIKP